MVSSSFLNVFSVAIGPGATGVASGPRMVPSCRVRMASARDFF